MSAFFYLPGPAGLGWLLLGWLFGKLAALLGYL